MAIWPSPVPPMVAAIAEYPNMVTIEITAPTISEGFASGKRTFVMI